MTLRKTYSYLEQMAFIVLLLSSSGALLAQERVVSGSVKDANGTGLTGVTVLVKNTTTGTTTNAEGKYSLSVGNNAVLLFSFIGYQAQEVVAGNQSVIDIVLSEDTKQLDEVVVTALGISRTTKALQSSVAKVPGASLTQARENNLGTSIQGRVAGVNVSSAGTGAGASSRVIIRGNKSIGGMNQPLYVVDGIPMDNTNFGQVGMWGGIDEGDGLTSINPDDIESISVLKGAAAAALYGSRGGYGVINITTKRGQARKGIGIEFNSNYVFETVMNLSDLQTSYGSGFLSPSDPNDPSSPLVYTKPSTQEQAFNVGFQNSWGPKFDGSPVIQFDGVSRPYSYAGDNWKRFYQTGHAWTNSIALSGGNANQTYRFSFSDMQNTYIIPNSGFDRINTSLSTDGKYGKKVTFNAKVLYSNENIKNKTMVSDSPGNPVQSIWALPGNVNVDDLLGDPKKLGAVAPGVKTVDQKSEGEEYQQSANLWGQNPWWAAYQYDNDAVRDRIITSANLRYNIMDWLYIQGQLGMDHYTRNSYFLTPQGTGYEPGGDKSETENRVREINLEWMLGINKKFNKIGVNSFVGGNKMVRETKDIKAYGSVFIIPYYTSVNNLQSRSYWYDYSKSGINSLFGSAEISYDNWLFITATARNDWFSVLNPAHNSKLYPSVGGSFVFTDAFRNLQDIFSYGKVRAAWGQVATANVQPYGANLTYSLIAQGHLGHAMGQFSNGFDIPNPNLVPALSTELEFGTDLKFFKGRLGLEFTYYDQKTTDDILAANVSNTSGFNTTTVNIGKLSNKGVELLINATPVSGPVAWDVSLNLAKNRNMVIDLGNGVNEVFVDEPRTRTVAIKHIVGYPYGMITGWVQKTDSNGNKVYYADGQPVKSDAYEILGNGVADLTGGLNNSVTWKRINLNFLIDFKLGGDIYSGTNVRLTEWGLHKQTLANREGGMVVEGVTNIENDPDKPPVYEPFSLTLNQEQTLNYWGNLGERDEAHFIYDASFIKLRQVSLEYSLPPKILAKTPFNAFTVSFVGRNLAILYKNIDNVDPESAYSSSNAQGLDYFGMPGTRSYGFNLKVVF